MKYFSTGFFVSDSTRFKDVFNECFGWIQDSPHTAFIPAQLSCDYKDEDFYIESKNERIEIITHKKESNNTLIGCFRYSKITTPHKWITDISFNKNLTTNKIWVQVESSVVSQEAAYLAPQPKKPLIVIRLIDRFSGGLDDEFKISVEPHNLDENGFELATKLINGDTDNKLPVIYVSSKYFYHEHAHNVIPERLARKVCGLAHVVVEPENKYFSSQLRASTNAKNAYAGAVGIYWPRGQSISYYRRGEKSAKEFEDVLFDEVVKATTTMAPVSDCGWSEIQNQKIRDSINTIREKGEYTHELMCLYEEDNITKSELIEDLKSKISILEHRVRSLQSQAPTQASISLNMGAELDFYNGEIKDVVIDSFSSALNNKKESSRGYHILSSLIDNNKHESETDERKKALKRALTGYRSMDKSTLRQLRELGFEATEEGKHWKLIYNEDPRYTYILPKTGSDHRGALNAISDINNIIF